MNKEIMNKEIKRIDEVLNIQENRIGKGSDLLDKLMSDLDEVKLKIEELKECFSVQCSNQSNEF